MHVLRLEAICSIHAAEYSTTVACFVSHMLAHSGGSHIQYPGVLDIAFFFPFVTLSVYSVVLPTEKCFSGWYL